MLPIRFRPIEMLLDLVEKGHFHAAQDLVPIVRATIDELILQDEEEEEESVIEADTLLDALDAAVAAMKEHKEESVEGELATEPQ